MPIDGKKYQTVLIKKEQAERLKKLSKDSRYPMTKLVNFAIDTLLDGSHEFVSDLISGRVKL